MTASAELLDEVVEASGLLPLIAPFTIRRLLIAADVSPPTLTRSDLEKALPQLERGLSVYLDDGQLAEALTKLRRLAATE